MFNDIISIISFVGLLISFIVKSDIPSRLLEGKLNKEIFSISLEVLFLWEEIWGL